MSEQESLPQTFLKELEFLLNRYGIDSLTGTPDFILAKYLDECIRVYEQAMLARNAWFGVADERTKIRGCPDCEGVKGETT